MGRAALRGRRAHASGAALVLVLLSSAPLSGGPAARWILAGVAPPDSPLVQRVAAPYARALGRIAGVRVQSRWGGIAGDESSSLEATRRGKVHVWLGSSGAIAEHAAPLGVLDAPYLFSSGEDLLRRATRARVLTPAVEAQLQSHGLTLVGAPFLSGWRAIETRARRIVRPEDLRGLRLRTQPSPLNQTLWTQLGTKTMQLDMRDVAIALRTGVIDAVDMPPLFLFASSASTEIRHLTTTRHVAQAGFVAFHAGTLAALPPKVRDAIEAETLSRLPTASQIAEELDTDLIGLLRQQGVTIETPTPDELARWKAAMTASRAPIEALGPEAVRLHAALTRAAP